jgi:hypothetical protein
MCLPVGRYNKLDLMLLVSYKNDNDMHCHMLMTHKAKFKRVRNHTKYCKSVWAYKITALKNSTLKLNV